MNQKSLTELNRLAEQFKKSVYEYLDHVKPEYNRDKKHFEFNEREIQAFFWNKLFNEANGKYRIKIEDRYSEKIKQRFDLMIEHHNNIKNDIYVEIEWSAKQTDGFGTHTFGDLEKLAKCTPDDNYGMFLSVNISDKYIEIDEIRESYSLPGELPLKDRSALKKVWENPKYKPLMQSHSKFWLSDYDHYKGKNNNTKFYVLVFACFGKKDKDGIWKK